MSEPISELQDFKWILEYTQELGKRVVYEDWANLLYDEHHIHIDNVPEYVVFRHKVGEGSVRILKG